MTDGTSADEVLAEIEIWALDERSDLAMSQGEYYQGRRAALLDVARHVRSMRYGGKEAAEC